MGTFKLTQATQPNYLNRKTLKRKRSRRLSVKSGVLNERQSSSYEMFLLMIYGARSWTSSSALLCHLARLKCQAGMHVYENLAALCQWPGIIFLFISTNWNPKIHKI